MHCVVSSQWANVFLKNEIGNQSYSHDGVFLKLTNIVLCSSDTVVFGFQNANCCITFTINTFHPILIWIWYIPAGAGFQPSSAAYIKLWERSLLESQVEAQWPLKQVLQRFPHDEMSVCFSQTLWNSKSWIWLFSWRHKQHNIVSIMFNLKICNSPETLPSSRNENPK